MNDEAVYRTAPATPGLLIRVCLSFPDLAFGPSLDSHSMLTGNIDMTHVYYDTTGMSPCHCPLLCISCV